MDDLRRVYVQPKPGYRTRCGACLTIMEPGQSCAHMVIIGRNGEIEDEHMALVNAARVCRVDVEATNAGTGDHAAD